MKERLVELVKNAHDEQKYLTSDKSINAIADYLLENGVIVLPCKVGDIVYKVYDIESVHRQILELEVLMIEVGIQSKVCLKTTKKYRYNFDKATFEDFGKTIFFTREEAQAKLKEGGKG